MSATGMQLGPRLNRQRTMDWLFDWAMPVPHCGCWIWLGTVNNKGYGASTLNGKKILAHRLAWMIANGPIPEGLDLDHLCRVTLCINPDHLEPVTRAENLRRGQFVGGWQRRLTHCAHGHALDAENTYRRPNGNRTCRACSAFRTRMYRKNGNSQ